MSAFSRFSNQIEKRDWNHVQFLRNIMLVLVLTVLFMYLLLLSLNLNGSISEIVFVELIRELLQGQLFGLIGGLLINFLALIPTYLKKEWDLHIVVPQALFVHILLTFILFAILYFFLPFSSIYETAVVTGFLIGGLIPILAFSGEVDKEHKEVPPTKKE